KGVRRICTTRPPRSVMCCAIVDRPTSLRRTTPRSARPNMSFLPPSLRGPRRRRPPPSRSPLLRDRYRPRDRAELSPRPGACASLTGGRGDVSWERRHQASGNAALPEVGLEPVAHSKPRPRPSQLLLELDAGELRQVRGASAGLGAGVLLGQLLERLDV